MAVKNGKKKVDMEDYDRWGTPPGITKTLHVTEENRRAAAEINAQRAAEAKKKAAAAKKKK